MTSEETIAGPTEALFAFDLVAPAKVLTPTWSPMRGSSEPPKLITLDPAPDGQVWVRIWWEDTGDDWSEIAWDQWCAPAAYEYMRRDLHLVPIDQLARWESVKREFRSVQLEVEESA